MTQALKQLAAMQELIDNRLAQASVPVSDVEIARRLSFAISRAAHGQANPRELATAKKIHFALFGTPEIDRAHFGSKLHKPTICFDGGKPNQLAPLDGDARSWGY